MQLKDKHGVQWLEFETFAQHNNLIHGFTTRNGGVSHPPFSSLNMGRSTADDPENVEENYKRILSALDLNDRSKYMTKQVHSNIVRFVDENVDEGTDNYIDGEDGLVTNRTDVTLITYYADCVPLFFYDPVQKAGGVVHSGWKGTSKRIGLKAVEKMTEVFGSKPSDIIAGIGPCASGCCYEIDQAVIDLFDWLGESLNNYLTPTTQGKFLIDLKGINKDIMLSAGIRSENIEISDHCTMCQNDLFFSYRKEKPKSGRMAAIFALKGSAE